MEADKPTGEQVICTMAMPKDTNGNGDIFGGWLVSQMDMGGAIFASRVCKGRTATVAIHSLTFKRPVKVGDVIACYARIEKRGRTSLTIIIEVWALPHTKETAYKVTEGSFVFVAIDKDGRPRPIDQPD